MCKTNEEINAFIDASTFSVGFVNNYFDFEDYSNMIKSYIDDSLFWELDSRVIRKANFLIQKNEANL